MINTHISYTKTPDTFLWLTSYLIYLSFLGWDSFLSLLLKDLLPLLNVFFRGHREGVVELIVAFVHHVPISVGLLWNRPDTVRNIKTSASPPSNDDQQVHHSLSGPPPTAPSRLHYQTGFRPRHHLSSLGKTIFETELGLYSYTTRCATDLWFHRSVSIDP